MNVINLLKSGLTRDLTQRVAGCHCGTRPLPEVEITVSGPLRLQWVKQLYSNGLLGTKRLCMFQQGLQQVIGQWYDATQELVKAISWGANTLETGKSSGADLPWLLTWHLEYLYMYHHMDLYNKPPARAIPLCLSMWDIYKACAWLYKAHPSKSVCHSGIRTPSHTLPCLWCQKWHPDTCTVSVNSLTPVVTSWIYMPFLITGPVWGLID